jgi:hypothetical protein
VACGCRTDGARRRARRARGVTDAHDEILPGRRP